MNYESDACVRGILGWVPTIEKEEIENPKDDGKEVDLDYEVQLDECKIGEYVEEGREYKVTAEVKE